MFLKMMFLSLSCCLVLYYHSLEDRIRTKPATVPPHQVLLMGVLWWRRTVEKY